MKRRSGATAPGGSGPRLAVWGLAVALLLLGGCAARAPETTYVVRRGDTLSGIGQRLAVPWEEIARVNRLRDPSRIHPGQVLEIPSPHRSRGRRPAAPAATRAAPADVAIPERPLLWPVAGGQVSSPFGRRGDGHHDGIDIRAPEGTPVLAAERGKVTFSGVVRGYGNVIAIRHPGGYLTVYGHNQSNWVRVGQAVHRGEVIATVGRTGRTTGSNLHFELRFGGRAVDPMPHLDAITQEAHRLP